MLREFKLNKNNKEMYSVSWYYFTFWTERLIEKTHLNTSVYSEMLKGWASNPHGTEFFFSFYLWLCSRIISSKDIT